MSSKSKSFGRNYHAWRILVLFCATFCFVSLGGAALAAGTTWYGPGTFSHAGSTTTTVSISGINRDLSTDTAFLLTNAGAGNLDVIMDKTTLTYGGSATGPVLIIPWSTAANLSALNVYVWGQTAGDTTAGWFEVGAPEGASNLAYGVKAFAPFTVYGPGMTDAEHWVGLWGKGGAFFEDGQLSLTQSLFWPVIDDKVYDLEDLTTPPDQYFNLHPQLISMVGVDGASRFNTGHAMILDAYDEAVATDWADIHPDLVDADLEGKMGRFYFTTDNISTGNVEKGLVTFSYEDGTPGIYLGDFSFGGDVTDPSEWTLPDVRLFRESANVLATDDLFKAYQVQTTAATGTPPLVVASTTKVLNLNADLLDGRDEAYFLNTGSTLDADTLDMHDSTDFLILDQSQSVTGRPTFNGSAAGTPAFSMGGTAPTEKILNLNADLLDDLTSTDFLILDQDQTITGKPTFTGIPSFHTGTLPTIHSPFDLTGDAPTNKVTNLNADLLDGHDSAYFLNTGSTLDADTLDMHDSTYFLNATDSAQTATGGLTLEAAANIPGSLILDSNVTSVFHISSTIEMLGTAHGSPAGTDGFLIDSGHYTGSDYTNAKLWNYEDSNVEIGTNNTKAFTIADNMVTIGSGTAGVDYELQFDGETNDGSITFDEDNAEFSFNQGGSFAGVLDVHTNTGDPSIGLTGTNDTNKGTTFAFADQVGYKAQMGMYHHTAVGLGEDFFLYSLGKLRFGTGGTSAATATDVIIDDDGRVGINTLTPSHTLDVNGAARVGSYLDLAPITAPANPSSGVRIYVDSSTGDLMARNSSGSIVTVANF